MTSMLGKRLVKIEPTVPSNWQGISLTHPDAGAAAGRHEPGARRTDPERGTEAAPARAGVRLELDRLEEAGLLSRATSRTALASTFRRLKLPLIANARDGGVRSSRRSLIMVTSAVSGEGKTFCAINLALSIAAEIDSSVLLVDADAEHAGLMHKLGVQSRPGLYDLLTQPELRLSDVTLQTNIDKLELLPAGTPHSLPGELLASESMQRLLKTITTSEPDRIVVFDAPPLLSSSEAAVLATLVGQVVLVVGASSTPQRAVLQALSSLEHCEIVLPLLNKARLQRQPS